ncbi:hypothetical protein ACP4OV_029948 [Aristida adscensionis]
MSPPPDQQFAPAATIQSSGSTNRCFAPYGWRPWASLHQDLVEQIGWRVLAGDLLDYVRMRAVCAHWSSSTVRPRGRGLVDARFHPRRWMMLPEGHGLYPGHPGLGGYVRFFNLSTSALLVRVHLPLIADHAVLDSPDGLLLLRRDHDAAIRLLHPFTGDLAELPSLTSLLPQMADDPYQRALREDTLCGEPRAFLDEVCAAVTVDAAGAITVMIVIYSFYCLAHATAGDQRWTLSAWKLPPRSRTVSFRGKLYGALMWITNTKLIIWQADPPQTDAEGLRTLPWPQKMTIECPLAGPIGIVNLVECGSELMVVGFTDTSFAHLVVYRFTDLISGRVIPVTSIGENVILVNDRALCLSPDNTGLPPFVPGNSIIRMHVARNDMRRRHNRVGRYHLGTRSWSPAIDGDILRRDQPRPSPIMLIHHIYTCCVRHCWNKGLLFYGGVTPNWSVKPNLRIEIVLGRATVYPSTADSDHPRSDHLSHHPAQVVHSVSRQHMPGVRASSVNE